jgi:hypothetical protein
VTPIILLHALRITSVQSAEDFITFFDKIPPESLLYETEDRDIISDNIKIELLIYE